MDEKLCWFASRTRYGQELSIGRKLAERGVEHFIPTKITTVERNGRRRKVEKPLINNLVFLRATKPVALELANAWGIPLHYIIDRSTSTLLVIPDKQMDDFVRVLGEEEEEVTGLAGQPVAAGDRIRVFRGKLKGVEGQVLEAGNKTYIVVSLCGLLQAKARVPRTAFEKI